MVYPGSKRFFSVIWDPLRQEKDGRKLALLPPTLRNTLHMLITDSRGRGLAAGRGGRSVYTFERDQLDLLTIAHIHS